MCGVLNAKVAKKVPYWFTHWLPGDLFLDGLSIGLSKEREESTGEIVGVAVGISQLVGYGIQEQVATYKMWTT